MYFSDWDQIPFSHSSKKPTVTFDLSPSQPQDLVIHQVLLVLHLIVMKAAPLLESVIALLTHIIH